MRIEAVVNRSGNLVPASEQSRQAAKQFFDASRACHESAHALIGLGKGARILRMTLDPVEAAALSAEQYSDLPAELGQPVPVFAGGCVLDYGSSMPAEDRGVIAVAGIVQQAFIGCPRFPVREDANWRSGLDVCTAESPTDAQVFIACVPPERRMSQIDSVHTLLRRDQRAVLALAAALEARGSLDGAEAESIIKAALAAEPTQTASC